MNAKEACKFTKNDFRQYLYHKLDYPFPLFLVLGLFINIGHEKFETRHVRCTYFVLDVIFFM